VDISPDLLDELKAHRQGSRWQAVDDLVSPTKVGTKGDRNNVRVRVLGKAIERANDRLAKANKPLVQTGVTNHTLRRTFASQTKPRMARASPILATTSQRIPHRK
jgi:integrase